MDFRSSKRGQGKFICVRFPTLSIESWRLNAYESTLALELRRFRTPIEVKVGFQTLETFKLPILKLENYTISWGKKKFVAKSCKLNAKLFVLGPPFFFKVEVDSCTLGLELSTPKVGGWTQKKPCVSQPSSFQTWNLEITRQAEANCFVFSLQLSTSKVIGQA